MHQISSVSRRWGIVSAFVLAAMLAIASIPGNALADQAGWTVQFGTDQTDNAFGVAVHGRSVYVAGSTQGSLPGQTSAGGTDAFVSRYNSRGELQWTRQFGTPEGDAALKVAARGNQVVVGGGTRSALSGQTWAGGQDIYLRAYDRKGDVRWTLQFGSPQDERPRDLTIGKDGSIFVAGQTLGQLTEEPSAGSTDAFVMRLDPDGTVRWLRQFGTAGRDEAIGVAVTEDAVYVTGVTDDAFPGQVNAGDFDSFVARLTLDGDFEWITQFGTSSLDGAWRIGVAGTTIFVSGNTTGQFPGETFFGGNDGFVAAFELDGALKWARQFGTVGNENAPALDVDDEGAVTAGRLGGMQPLGSAQDPAADAFARKYDAEGNVLWMIQVGTAAFDNAQDVALKGGDVYLVGTTQGSFPGYANAGRLDAWVMRIRGDFDHDQNDNGDEDDDD